MAVDELSRASSESAASLTLGRAREIKRGIGRPPTEAERAAQAKLKAAAAKLGAELKKAGLLMSEDQKRAWARTLPAGRLGETRPQATARESRPRAKRAARSSRDDPDEPEPPLGRPDDQGGSRIRCAACGRPIKQPAGRGRPRLTCSDPCRKRFDRLKLVFWDNLPEPGELLAVAGDPHFAIEAAIALPACLPEIRRRRAMEAA